MPWYTLMYVCLCCDCDPPCCCWGKETGLCLRCQELDGCQQCGLKCVSACCSWVISTAHWAECTVLARGHHYGAGETWRVYLDIWSTRLSFLCHVASTVFQTVKACVCVTHVCIRDLIQSNVYTPASQVTMPVRFTVSKHRTKLENTLKIHFNSRNGNKLVTQSTWSVTKYLKSGDLTGQQSWRRAHSGRLFLPLWAL